MALARTRLFSDALGLCVTVDVILPQRRDNASNHKLPVLWLLHGAFGNHADWIRRTSIERYVAPYGLAVVMPSAQNSCYCDMAHGGKYYTFISKELPQKLRTMFNFSENREDNFIAGLSWAAPVPSPSVLPTLNSTAPSAACPQVPSTITAPST